MFSFDLLIDLIDVICLFSLKAIFEKCCMNYSIVEYLINTCGMKEHCCNTE